MALSTQCSSHALSSGRRHFLQRLATVAVAGAAPARSGCAAGFAAASKPSPALWIDMHHHFYPPEYLKAFLGSAAARGIPLPAEQKVGSPERAVAQLDNAGIRTAVLSIASTPGQWFDWPTARPTAAVGRMACMEGRIATPGLDGLDRLLGDLLRRDRPVRRHARLVHRARHRAGDDDLARDAQTGSATTVFSMWPMPSISTRITSPTFRKQGGVIAAPTPEGVPVASRSPGSSVITVDK